MTELLQFRTVLSVLLISLYVKPICVLIAFRSEQKHLTSFGRKSICITFCGVSVADRLPPTFVCNKSYKYEPEIIRLSTIVISTLPRWMGPARVRRSRRNRLWHNGGSSDSCSLILPIVTCRSSLFVDRDAMYFATLVSFWVTLFHFIL